METLILFHWTFQTYWLSTIQLYVPLYVVVKAKWHWKFYNSHWLCEVFKFNIVSLIELKLKLEVNFLGVGCLFNEDFEFVVKDYAMLQQLL
jgi:hypothetical protein